MAWLVAGFTGHKLFLILPFIFLLQIELCVCQMLLLASCLRNVLLLTYFPQGVATVCACPLAAHDHNILISFSQI